MKKRLSVSYELTEVAYALDGVRLLIELGSSDQAASEHDARAAPLAASAITSLVGCRLRDLCRAMRGDLDPDLLLTAFNESDGGPDQDLYLVDRTARRRRTEV